MDTNSLRDTILKISDVARKLLQEAEEIYKEGKRRAREKTDTQDRVETAEKNFSIERPEDKSVSDFH